jgi:hypothetical protein
MTAHGILLARPLTTAGDLLVEEKRYHVTRHVHDIGRFIPHLRD